MSFDWTLINLIGFIFIYFFLISFISINLLYSLHSVLLTSNQFHSFSIFSNRFNSNVRIFNNSLKFLFITFNSFLSFNSIHGISTHFHSISFITNYLYFFP